MAQIRENWEPLPTSALFPNAAASPTPEKQSITPENLQSYVERSLLKCSSHPIYPHLKIYNYTDKAQYRKKWDKITLACRGLVVNTLSGKIIARPMPKFFDWTSHRHTASDSDSVSILEKLDGSLCIMFHYNGSWHMATRGNFSSVEAKLGMEIAAEMKLYDKCDIKNTYCFEVIHPTRRILVDYKDRRDLVLLAVLETETGYDYPNDQLPTIAEKLGVQCARSFSSIDGVMGLQPEEMMKLDRDNEEGFVIRFDSTGERCKVKLENYLKLTRVKNHGSLDQILVILSNPDEKYVENQLSQLPDEFYEEVKEVHAAFNNEKVKSEEEFERLVDEYKGKELKSLPVEIKMNGSLMRYLRMTLEGEKDEKRLEESQSSFVIQRTKIVIKKMFEGREEFSSEARGTKQKKKKKSNRQQPG